MNEIARDLERIEEVPSGTYRPGHVTPLENSWLALAHASRVKDKPIQRRLYNRLIVLWRGEGNKVSAMEDRCAHRRAPLSAGKVVGGALQCPYHGWSFDIQGHCVRIPSLGPGAEVREAIRVRTYPTIERYGYVWIWWGDPAAADPALLPHIPFIHPDKPNVFELTVSYDCAADLLVENVLDLTHIDFVHGWLLGDPYGGPEEVTCESTSEILTMQRRANNRRPPIAQAALFGFPKSQNFVGLSRVYLRSNLIVSGVSWTPPGWGQFTVIPVIPEAENRIRGDASLVVFGPGWYRKIGEWLSGLVAAQDNRILKLQHAAYHEWSHMTEGRRDVSVLGDKASVRYRALRQDLVERQAHGDLAYAEDWATPPANEALQFPKVW